STSVGTTGVVVGMTRGDDAKDRRGSHDADADVGRVQCLCAAVSQRWGGSWVERYSPSGRRFGWADRGAASGAASVGTTEGRQPHRVGGLLSDAGWGDRTSGAGAVPDRDCR